MKLPLNVFKNFNTVEKTLWIISVVFIIITFVLFNKGSVLVLIASLIGVTSLILNAKGNPFGQFLMILFSLMYGVISYRLNYFGEMITYIFMTLPMAVVSLIAWLKHPFGDDSREVEVRDITKNEVLYLSVYTVIVTIIFYFVLKYFNNSYIIPSTISISTSFIAAYLTYKRNHYFALAYASNDIVLIILWSLATLNDIQYISVLTCFIIFLINDLYGYINWKVMRSRQILA